MIVECQVLTYNSQFDDLGIKDQEDIWLPCAIDFKEVVAVKRSDADHKDEAAVYFRSGDRFVVDIHYDYVVHLFKFSRGRDTDNWVKLARETWMEKYKRNDKSNS